MKRMFSGIKPSGQLTLGNYIKALNNGDAAVFAGAGLSASSGCVNWKQLLGEIAEELQLDIEKESDLVAIAQYYYNKNGSNRTRLNDIIKDAFQTGKNPNVNHNILARLPVSTYWTTNYDRLIEKALLEQGKTPDIKKDNRQLFYAVLPLSERTAILNIFIIF